jgi:hypothetical protein
MAEGQHHAGMEGLMRAWLAALVVLLATASAADAQVIIVYSRTDRAILDRVLVHLRPLERAGVEVWADVRLRPGDPWRDEIQRAIGRARVAIVLVSADFLASDYVAQHELPPILAAAAAGRLRVFPVIVGPSSFDRDALAEFQSVNDPRRPLVAVNQAEQEAVYARLAEAVAAAVTGRDR